MDLIQGQNTKLQSRFFELEISSVNPPDINFCAILLHENRLIPSANEIAQRHWCNYPDIFEFESETVMTVDLDNIDVNNVEKILVCADLSLDKDRRADQVGDIQLTLHDKEKVSFTFESAGRNERAIILGEVYRHKEAWKFRALGAGFMEGMTALLRSFSSESIHTEYVNRSKPANQPAGTNSVELDSAPVAPVFSGFNKEPETAISDGSSKRFEWGTNPELNVLEVCGLLGKTKVEDSYFSLNMSIHIGALAEMWSGKKIRLDHEKPDPKELDDLIWLFPEEKEGITTHTLVVAKEAYEHAKKITVFAYIESDIPYWKRAKPRFFVKPNSDQTVELVVSHHDMACFALCFGTIELGQNGVEISSITDYLDTDREII